MTQAFTIISALVMLTYFVSALAHRWTFSKRIKKIPAIDLNKIENQFSEIELSNLSDWHRLIQPDWPVHPSTNTIIWTLEKPHRLTNPTLMKEHLEREVRKPFEDLDSRSAMAISTVPLVVLMFTTLGIALFGLLSGGEISPSTLMQIMGPAMLTTTAGAFIAILEKRFLMGKLKKYQLELYETGDYLLHCLRDVSIERMHQRKIATRLKEAS